MKSLALLVMAVMAGMPAVSQADMAMLRQLDDMNFDVMDDARELRWLIRMEFVEAPNFGLLLNDSTVLLLEMRALEDGLFRELPMPLLLNDLNHVRAVSAELRLELTTPCVTCVKPDVILYGGERFVIEEPRPVIVLPTDLALEMLDLIDSKLMAMEDVMLGRVPAVIVPEVDVLPPVTDAVVIPDATLVPDAVIEGIDPAIDAIPASPLIDGELPVDGTLPLEGDLIGIPPMGEIPAADLLTLPPGQN